MHSFFFISSNSNFCTVHCTGIKIAKVVAIVFAFRKTFISFREKKYFATPKEKSLVILTSDYM
jgi:hypothetical protein